MTDPMDYESNPHGSATHMEQRSSPDEDAYEQFEDAESQDHEAELPPQLPKQTKDNNSGRNIPTGPRKLQKAPMKPDRDSVVTRPKRAGSRPESTPIIGRDNSSIGVLADIEAIEKKKSGSHDDYSFRKHPSFDRRPSEPSLQDLIDSSTKRYSPDPFMSHADIVGDSLQRRNASRERDISTQKQTFLDGDARGGEKPKVPPKAGHREINHPNMGPSAHEYAHSTDFSDSGNPLAVGRGYPGRPTVQEDTSSILGTVKSFFVAPQPARGVGEQSINHRLRADRDELWRQVNGQSETIHQLLDGRDHLRAEVAALQKAKVNQEAQIKSLQVEVMSMKSESNFIGEQESTFHQKLQVLYTDKIWDFAKRYAGKSLSALENVDINTAESFRTTLMKFIRCDNGVFPDTLLANMQYGPQLCLGAYLSYEITTRIFQRPFWFLENSNILEKYHKEMMEVDESEAHLWRAQLIRLMDRSLKKPPSPNNPAPIIASERTAAIGAIFGHFIEAGLIKALLKPDLDQKTVEGKLTEIIRFASELSCRMWQQRTSLKVAGLDQFADMVYEANSEFMEPHRYHKIEPDEEESLHSLDGYRPRIIVFPAIVACGTVDGENYETSQRLWAKAIVWLDKSDTQEKIKDVIS